MKKSIAIVTLAAGFSGLGAGALLATPHFASAATDRTGVATAPAASDTNRPDPGARLAEALKPLVDKGTITQAQADAVLEAIKAARPADGQRGPGGPGGPHLSVVATALGMTPEELRTAMQGGTTTIAQLAASKGVSVDTVVKAIVDDMASKLTQAVTDGKLTQAEADAKKAAATTRVTEQVNNVPPAGGPQGGRGGRGAPTAPASTSSTPAA